MNITCNKKLLQKYIIIADKITGKNLTLPILNSILLITNKKILTIRATNLEVGVEFYIPIDVIIEGSIALPGSIFANILNNIPDDEKITINNSKNICKITTKTKNVSIKGFSPEDFPTIPINIKGETFIMQSEKFTQGVKAVISSSATSNIKQEIASVYIHKIADMVVFTATDSFRLSEKKINQNNTAFSQGVIIPTKNILDIVRILESTNEEIEFNITKNQISCTGKSTHITSRVIQGVYPDYEQIIPKTYTTEVIILKQDLINTLKLSTIFSDKFNKITVNINPKEKICMISTKNTEIGETESAITATTSGDPIEISLNGKHLFECLGSIEKDSVVMQFSGADKPAVIRGLGDPSFTYLTMPLTR